MYHDHTYLYTLRGFTKKEGLKKQWESDTRVAYHAGRLASISNAILFIISSSVLDFFDSLFPAVGNPYLIRTNRTKLTK